MNGFIGQAAAWLLLPVVAFGFAVVFLRYAAGLSYPWFSEIYLWLNGAVVMLSAAYVLREDGHVRVDLFYKNARKRTRAWVDLVGVWTLLLPMMGTIFYLGLPVVERSFRLREGSPTPDGLGFFFVIKGLVLVFCVLVSLQGLAISARAVLTLASPERSEGTGQDA